MRYYDGIGQYCLRADGILTRVEVLHPSYLALQFEEYIEGEVVCMIVKTEIIETRFSSR